MPGFSPIEACVIAGREGGQKVLAVLRRACSRTEVFVTETDVTVMIFGTPVS